MAEWNFDEMAENYGNEYLQEHQPDDCVESMDLLDDIYSEVSPTEVLRRAFFGGRYGFENDSFNPNDDYFYFDGYGNLVSVTDYDYIDCLKSQIDNEESFKEWCVEMGYFDEEDE